VTPWELLNVPPHGTMPDHGVFVPTGVHVFLSSNDRGSWHQHYRTIAGWRDAAKLAVLAARVPPMRSAYVLAELRFKRNVRRDAGNYYPTGKAVMDGVVDSGVLDDDSVRYLTGPDMRIGPIVGKAGAPGIVLHIWRRP
jgi:crossover junction endodeoxyribonuclease RusA